MEQNHPTAGVKVKSLLVQPIKPPFCQNLKSLFEGLSSSLGPRVNPGSTRTQRVR